MVFFLGFILNPRVVKKLKIEPDYPEVAHLCPLEFWGWENTDDKHLGEIMAYVAYRYIPNIYLKITCLFT